MTHDTSAHKPRNIAVAGRELALAWADGHESYLPFDDLRAGCPCSLCRSHKEAKPDPLRVVTAPARGQVMIKSLVPVGAYAVQIVWSDGHDTGIYAFESLRKACPCPECRSIPQEAGGR
jgi:DUF971 family protein